jgi:hypothetical protein
MNVETRSALISQYWFAQMQIVNFLRDSMFASSISPFPHPPVTDLIAYGLLGRIESLTPS